MVKESEIDATLEFSGQSKLVQDAFGLMKSGPHGGGEVNGSVGTFCEKMRMKSHGPVWYTYPPPRETLKFKELCCRKVSLHPYPIFSLRP